MKQRLLPVFLAVLLAAQLVPAHAQRGDRDDRGRDRIERPQRFKPPSHLSREERQQLREDVNSAGGQYGDRHGGRALQRMAPEDREKLRQDIQEYNRDRRR